MKTKELQTELLRLEAKLRMTEKMDSGLNPVHYDRSYYVQLKQHNKSLITRLNAQIADLKNLLQSKNTKVFQRDLFDFNPNYQIPD